MKYYAITRTQRDTYIDEGIDSADAASKATKHVEGMSFYLNEEEANKLIRQLLNAVFNAGMHE